MATTRGYSTPRGWRWPVALYAVTLLGAVTTSCHRVSTAPREREVVLGGLVSLTGSWATLGQTSRVALELAVDDVNQYLAGNPANVRFVTAIEDTRLDPEVALEKAKALRARGVQLLIGPQSSAEVERIKPFADANGLLVVSQSSTAASLAREGDNVFRFTPSDSLEGVAVSALMWDDGIRAIVPVWRDDAGNIGVKAAGRTAFIARGGAVLAGVGYGPTTTDFRGTVASVTAQVEQAIARYGEGKVAIHLAAFDEVVNLFAAAAADSLLRSVKWYGSDGVARSAALVANRQAAEFASRVGYPNPIFGLDEGARDIWEPLAARIRARTKLEPDAFALGVYDAVWVVARGFIASGATLGIEDVKRAFTTAASTQFGATGWTVLNAAGDRKYGDFDFWAVRPGDGAPEWVRVARYETRTGRVVR